MSELPLHVQVAEALGWTRTQRLRDPTQGNLVLIWLGQPPGELIVGYECPPIPRYDTDWAATGPEIERLGIMIFPARWHGREPFSWAAGWPGSRYVPEYVAAPTDLEDPQPPLIAACRLILALKAEGKLNA